MYILIADSGSTKTDWVLLKDSKIIKQIKTMGFNPYFQTQTEIVSELENALKPNLIEYLDEINNLYYYGAGCSTSENSLFIENCIKASLKVKNIVVSHDLLAAARALCKNEWGIACILGTGSNSCLYNGSIILENIPSVGYLWGDHASGAQIGKNLIKNYFEGNLPEELKFLFEKEGYHREEILNNVYKKPMPSRYLASISLFVGKNKEHYFINNLLIDCFRSFFEFQVNKYTNSTLYKVHSVGSIGYTYKDIFINVAQEQGYQIGNIIKSPIDGLIEYHSLNK